MNRFITDARVRDVEKRRLPSKHYVYVVHLTWSDGTVNIIYRRYSRFFDFHMKIMTIFSEEAGARNPANRSIPFLPGKKVFGRSNTREVAMKRMNQIDEYCRILVKLPVKISRCDEVKEFFLPTQEDINPPSVQEDLKGASSDIDVISEPIQAEQYTVIADYKKQQRNEVDLVAGETVEVFEKNENGWWFVSVQDSQGWAPGTFLTRGDGKDDEEEFVSGNEENFITNNKYTAEQADELSFETGIVVSVMRKSLDGWWLVRYQEKEGWVPATYLQKYSGPAPAPSTKSQALIGNVMSVSREETDDTPDPHRFRQRDGRDHQKPSPKEKGDHRRFNTEAKPTPPRRSTVRKSLSRGSNRSGIRRQRRNSEYYTTAAYDASGTQGEAIGFKANQTVEVLQQDVEWWYVRINGNEGWAPASYIAVKQSELQREGSAVSVDSETGEEKRRPGTTPQIGGNGAFKPFTKTNNGPKKELKMRPLPSTPSKNTGADFRRHSCPANAVDDEIPPPLPPKMPIIDEDDFQVDYTNVNELNTNQEEPVNSKAKPQTKNQVKKPTVKPKPGGQRNSNVDENSISALRDQLERTIGNNNKPGVKKNNNKGRYITIGAYEGVEDEDGLSFEEGVYVDQILEKDESGWWNVRIGHEEGWVPSTYLEMV